ncbi:MAG: chemotaxis protein CheB, partial [Thermodesulfobacteriota bacterium]|nr:chemotaxis protein CheB [Thermodesulfobacteriota bacterium]
SVVFGMPKEAIALGCVDQVSPLDNIAPMIMSIAKKRR